MPKRTGELRYNDTEDADEGKLKKKCRNCNAPNVMVERVARLHDRYVDKQNAAGRTIIAVCSNPDCFRYVKLAEVESWVRTTA